MKERTEVTRTAVEVIGIVSVVASLLFVGLEIQQNSSVARVQAQQATTEILNNVFAIAAEDPAFANLIISVNTSRTPLEDLDGEQISRLYFINLMFLQAGQTAFHAANSGVIDDKDIVGMSDGNLINPFVRSYWSSLKQNLDSPYAVHLESIAGLE